MKLSMPFLSAAGLDDLYAWHSFYFPIVLHFYVGLFVQRLHLCVSSVLNTSTLRLQGIL